MERLTQKAWRNLDPWECCGQDNYCTRGCHDVGGCRKGCIVPKLYDRLAYYEDLAEQRRLVVLPCKPGDVLWSFYNRPQKRVCSDRVIDCSYLDGVCMIHSDLWGVTHADAIGKTVFLTRAEAEAALTPDPASEGER